MTSALEEKAAQQLRRRGQRLQLLLMLLETWMNGEDLQGMAIERITVRSGADRGGEVLVIVKARMEGQPWVGFHSAQSPEEAIRGALERIRNNDLKWREDTPYEG